MKFQLAGIAAVATVALGNARAQTPDSVSVARQFYVGAGVGGHWYYSINPPFNRARPVYLLAGYSVTPKVSVQVELQNGHLVDERRDVGFVDGENCEFYFRQETRSNSVTVLARFNRSKPQRHLQFDWLVGLAVVNGVFREEIRRTSSTRTDKYTYQPLRNTEPHLVGGISLRYLISPSWSVGSELMLSKNLLIVPRGGYGLMPGGGVNLGATYRFKPVK